MKLLLSDSSTLLHRSFPLHNMSADVAVDDKATNRMVSSRTYLLRAKYFLFEGSHTTRPGKSKAVPPP